MSEQKTAYEVVDPWAKTGVVIPAFVVVEYPADPSQPHKRTVVT